MDSIETLVRRAGYSYRQLPEYIREDLKTDRDRSKGVMDDDEAVWRIQNLLSGLTDASAARRDDEEVT